MEKLEQATDSESLPLAPKRPRTDCLCDFLLTTQTFVSPLLTSPRNVRLVCTEQNGHTSDEKPSEQDTESNVSPPAEDTTAHTGSPNVCVIIGERHFLHPKQYDQQDKLGSSPLSGSQTFKDPTTDMSNHPECQLLEKSLEDKPPGDCSVPSKNGMSNHAEVRCQSDFPDDYTRHGASLSTCSQSATYEESNQREDEHNFTDKEEREHERRDKSSADIREFQLFVCRPDEGIPVIFVEDKRKVEICDSTAVCARETNDQTNDKGRSDFSSPVECAEGSLISYDSISSINIATETQSTDDIAWAKGELGETKVEARGEIVDHTPKNHMSGRISQECTEGDNDADPFCVIEPAVWRETVREAEGIRSNSGSSTGEELPPSVKVCELEIPLAHISDVRPLDMTVQSSNQSEPQLHEDKKENLSQFYTQTQSNCTVSCEKHNTTGYEGSCHPASSPQRPTNPFPAGDGIQESCVRMGHHLHEQSSCSPVSCDNLKAQYDEHPQAETGTRDESKNIKEMTGFANECGLCKYEIKSVAMILQQNRPDNDVMTEQPAVEGLTEVTKLTHDDTQCCFTEYHQTDETLKGKDELLDMCFPLISDAVVPGPHELSPKCYSQSPDITTAPKSKARLSSLPSAFCLYNHVPGGFDSFHKIQLSPDDDEDDNAGQGDCQPHTSMSMQLIKSPQMNHYVLEAEGDEDEEMPKEMEEDQVHDEGGIFKCHTDDVANGSYNRATNYTELVSGQEIIAFESYPNEPATDSSGCSGPQSIQYPEFDLKKEFDLVLKELNLYFFISRSDYTCDNGVPTLEQRSDVACSKVSKGKSHTSSPELTLQSDPASEPRQTELKRTACSFMCQPLLQTQQHTLPWQAKRLEPLRTCTRPIRLGLSKRAKPKTLHRHHPYKGTK
ncbi:uncharacterized protein LOC129172353 isoform X2 [Dunckerocampus dactyliophorus]|uniref:uncharacterized protein LOC129172353 isoform X2 n=1 Tax=Dunckerocampus dactyliophorus TaxID=161453 RepID=UPI0024070892|nr:uncharacterized protein LOC129172353 isoform X2 [Dunckerocampus dactyliophorus]